LMVHPLVQAIAKTTSANKKVASGTLVYVLFLMVLPVQNALLWLFGWIAIGVFCWKVFETMKADGHL